jgi:hypothetical protein
MIVFFQLGRAPSGGVVRADSEEHQDGCHGGDWRYAHWTLQLNNFVPSNPDRQRKFQISCAAPPTLKSSVANPTVIAGN